MSVSSVCPKNVALTEALAQRPMTPADLDAVECIERSIYEFPWTRGNLADSLSAGYDCHVYELSGEVCAYAILMQGVDEVHLLNLSVSSRWQGRGLGRLVLSRLCEHARLKGGGAMLLEVRPSNQVALRLYESAGFQRIGLRKAYYPARNKTREDAIVMKWSSEC